MTRHLPQTRCSECGAENNAFAAKCWICQRPLVDEAELVQAITDKPPRFTAGIHTKQGNVLLLLTFFALLVVGVGIATINPVLLIFYGILVCLPGLAVGISLRQILAAKDKPTTTSGLTFLLVLVSVGGLLVISVGIMCFTLCYLMIEGPN